MAREPRVRDLLERAAREETDHLAWTQRRLEEVGGRRSILEPLFYAGSFTLGAAAGLIGDRWNLGFLAETERQVEQHLDGHLERLPEEDARSRAILGQMKADEIGHAVTARREGGTDLPLPVRVAMRLASRVMTVDHALALEATSQGDRVTESAGHRVLGSVTEVFAGFLAPSTARPARRVADLEVVRDAGGLAQHDGGGAVLLRRQVDRALDVA